MRVTIEIDSASASEAEAFVFAFQRTRKTHPLPHVLNTEPTVRIMGIGWGVTTPPITPEHASALVAEFDTLRVDAVPLRAN